MHDYDTEINTGEMLAVTVAGEEQEVNVKGLLRRVEYLEGMVIDQAKRAHQQYHLERTGNEDWRTCTLMVCLDAQDILRESTEMSGGQE